MEVRMATYDYNTRIKLKRDTSSNWTSADPVILNGEMILVDTAEGQLRAKIGDGTKTYSQLPFTDETLRALITNVDAKKSAVVIAKDNEETLLNTFNIVKLLKTEYDALIETGEIDENAFYLVEEEPIEDTSTSIILLDSKSFDINTYTQRYYQDELDIFWYSISATNEATVTYKVSLANQDLTSVTMMFGNPDTTISGLTKTINWELRSGAVDGELISSGSFTLAEVYNDQWQTSTLYEKTLDLNLTNLTGDFYLVVTSDYTASKETHGLSCASSNWPIISSSEFLNTLNIYRVTQDEYNLLIAADALDPKAVYVIKDPSSDYLPLKGGTLSGPLDITDTTASTSTTTGALVVDGGVGIGGEVYANAVHGAVWNDFAEFRQANSIEPGRVVIENGDDTMSLSTQRLQLGGKVISDTFGFSIGRTKNAETPVAVAGRVLAYTQEDREIFRNNIGRPVCSGENGTISIMSEEEERLYPSAILGYVSSVPDYSIWEDTGIAINGRIWIYVR